MKTLFLFLISFAIANPFNSNAQKNSTEADKPGMVFFEGTWDEVLAHAKKEKKPIFVDAYAVWCGPCKYMSNNVFPDETVGEFFNENFINYKFDMEKGDGPTFARKYVVTAYPTFIFFDADGTVQHRTRGGRAAEGFIDLGKTALEAIANN